METTFKTSDSINKIEYRLSASKKAASRIHEAEINDVVPDLEDHNLLIAENDIYSYEIMKHQLHETKATLFHAKTGTEAIKILETQKIDMAFLDPHGLNGLEVLKQIRQREINLPVIAHTAFALKNEIERMVNAGFNELILKPYSKEYLYTLLNKYVKQKNQCFT